MKLEKWRDEFLSFGKWMTLSAIAAVCIAIAGIVYFVFDIF